MNRRIISEIGTALGEQVYIKGWLHRIRKLKSITFLIIRDRSGMVQCVTTNEKIDLVNLKLESVVGIYGLVKEGKNDIGEYELEVSGFDVISEVKEELPIVINQKTLGINLDTMLNNRVLSLRNEKISGIFKLQNIIVNGFREYLLSQGFTEIFTPKIVGGGAEGGTEIFEVKYFESKAYLAQSPQFYKQMMVGAGYERVFEVGHVYRAEEHNTSRHLNEYVSMDFEMGFIENVEEVMRMEEGLLRHIIEKLTLEGEKYIKLLELELPKLENSIPRISFKEAVVILKREYNKTELEGDIDPEGEKLLYKYSKERLGSEFLFLTDYPRKKRPMYAMPKGENETHSFDLLFRGIEITTGGQRIHDYEMLIENMKYKNLEPENYMDYTSVFKYGMPPHGGLAIGLERLTTKLIGLENVREASLFPRDRTRVTP